MMKSIKFLSRIIILSLFALAAFATSYCIDFSDSSCVHLDGTPLGFTSRFTIESWFNIREFKERSALIDFGTFDLGPDDFIGYGIYVLDSNRLEINAGNTNRYTSIMLEDIKPNIWQHIAVTYDKYKNDENLTVFLNGLVVAKGDLDATLEYPESFRPYGVFLGACREGLELVSLKGSIDEVRFWSVVRSNEEIRSDMTQALAGDETGLKGYYTFDSPSDSVLLDQSDIQNHGTVENIPDSCWQLSYAQVAVKQPVDVSFERFVLTWTDSPDMDSYCIDMSEVEDFSTSCTGFPITDVVTNYLVLDNMVPGSYYYRVKGHYAEQDIAEEPWTDIQIVSTVTDAPLPVTLTDFSLLPAEDKIGVCWQTASQVETMSFRVQRSTDSGPWQTVAEISGAGTNSDIIDYHYDDHNVTPDVLYTYRLLDIDYSGKMDTSFILSATLSASSAPVNITSIYPNPFNPTALVTFRTRETCEIDVAVYSLRGERVETLALKVFPEGEHRLSWNPDGLPGGIYLLRFQADDFQLTDKLLYLK